MALKFTKGQKVKQKVAFTLAEVLITLGIIGVVAALTLPTLIANYREKQTVTRLKKEYSTIAQAYTMAITNDGEFADWFTGNETSLQKGQVFYEHVSKYMNIAKNCGSNPGCFTPRQIKTLDGRLGGNYDNEFDQPKIILADGSSWMFFVSTVNCTGENTFCGNIKVDIDGPKKGDY